MSSSIELLFQGAGLVAFLLGLGLLLAPARLYQSYRKSRLSLLDTPFRVERFVYHRHRAFGLLIILGAGYTLLALASLPGLGGDPLVRSMLDSPVGILFAANGVALILGLVILIRPSLLKRPEAVANRWIPVLGEAGRNSVDGGPDLKRLRWMGAMMVIGGGVLLVVNHFS